ncbi:MAG: hypothetical protein V9F06_01525 [Thermomicrobiales bacterium]
MVGWTRTLPMLRVFGQPEVLPGLAAVGGLVDAVAVGDVAADGRLAHADVDDVGVGLGNGDRAHRGALEEAVGDVPPVLTAVVGSSRRRRRSSRTRQSRASTRGRPP